MTAALPRKSGCAWHHKEIASSFPGSGATRRWVVCQRQYPNSRSSCKSTIRQPRSPIESLGAGEKKAMVPSVLGGRPWILPSGHRRCSEISTTGSMAEANFVKRHWARADRLSIQDKVVRCSAEFPRQCEYTEALATAISAYRLLPFEPPYEKRYPYLDRSLLEFMFAIPREQLVRPEATAFPHASRTRWHRSG